MKNRRKFMSVTGLAVAGISITGLRGQSLDGHRSTAERDVFRVVARYGSRQSVQRKPGSTESVAIKVRMHSHEAFAETFAGQRGVPFEKVHAAGNTLRFQHNGVNFLLENVA